MQTLTQIKELLESHGLRPKRSLGQNFLTDHNLIRKLADAAELGRDQTVLEVGPGTGTLTEELLARGCRVVACELDDGLAALLNMRIPSLLGPDASQRFTLVHGDCLDGRHAVSSRALSALGDGPFKLVANLPYGAATPLIAALLTEHPGCGLMAVTVQKELGDRLTARPGTKDYGPLTVLASLSAEVGRIATAPPGCFWPQPEVTSVMLLLRRRADAPPSEALRQVSELTQRLFAHRRKQLGSVVRSKIDWDRARAEPGCEAIVPTMRAEELRPEQFAALARVFGT